MEMTSHLSEAELAEFVSDPSKGLGTHLEFCDSCLNEVARLRQTVADLKTAGQKPQEFWDRQRDAIRTQIAAAPLAPAPKIHRLAWAPVLAVIVLAGLLVSGGAPAPQAVQPQAAVDPDHQLLLAVEHVMQSSGPEAFEPATYFVQEIRQETGSNSTRNQEKRNAN